LPEAGAASHIAAKYPALNSPRFQQRFLCLLYLLIIVWLNGYICRQAFFIEYTGKMNSMHGFWIAIAKLAGDHWYKPSWWPYWYNGMPFEYTYAPLVPGLTAAISRLSGFSAARAFLMVSAGVYCLSPAALFLMARQLTRRTGWSFIAAIVYSFSAASELLLPDANFSLSHLRDARRLYLSFVWDEVPHQLGLALVCVAILFLARAMEDHRFRSYLRAGLCISLALLSSAFGATALLLLAACLLATCEGEVKRRNLSFVLLCGLMAYLAMCPYLPPSLILTIRSDAKVFPLMAWTAASFWTLAGVAGGGFLLWLVSRQWRPWYLRCFFLFAYLAFAIPALDKKYTLHFLPEAGRYTIELELALVLLLVFGIALLVDRLPKAARIVLAIALLGPLYQQVASQRRFSRNVIAPADITKTIEYQIARWIEPNLPGWRVSAPGSVWPWLNTFSKVRQFSGGSFPTAPNVVQLRADWELPGDVHETAIPVLWYKAYGVDAVIEPGPDSPEFWQPHEHGHQFDAALPVIWEQSDTRIYAVPRPVRSLAHVIPRSAVVSRAPTGTADNEEVKTYVAALEAPAAPIPAFLWLDDNRARVHASVAAGQVISVQVTYHPGWKATAGNAAVPLSKDGLGQMILSPGHAGEYDITLSYDGGWEAWLCRAVSAIVIFGTALAFFRVRRKRAA